MRHVAPLFSSCVLLTALASPAAAAPAPRAPLGSVCAAAPVAPAPWLVTFGATEAVTAVTPSRLRLPATLGQDQAPARRVVAVEYSDAYKVRAKIHKLASFTTLPIFGAMYVVGQDLYNHPGDSDSKKGLHSGLAATTGVLFGVNTITGGWNLWEGRKDPHHRGRRMAHGIMMLAADAGFLATGMLAPDDEHDHGVSVNASDRRGTHRAVALTSMGVATASYLMMLFWGE